MAKEIMISRYANTYDSKPKDVSISDFLKGIMNGEWQDKVLETRVLLEKAKDKKEKNKIKAKNVLFRVSGSFAGQKDSDLRKHSGFIAIDIDNVENPNSCKELIKSDPYVYASFISISGHGLCVLFKIDGERHEEAFNGISEYLYSNYQLIADQSCRNVSRARYVSYDPYLFVNEDAITFKKYPPKKKEPKVKKVVYVENDFSQVIKDIYDRGINLCETYKDWLSVCFAITSQFGDTQEGLDYFDTLSRVSSKYNADDCKALYKTCLKYHNENKSKQSTISLIYHHAKCHGIETYSAETKAVIRAAASQSKAGVSAADIAKGLQKFNEIPEEFSAPIIKQVIEQGIEHQTENIIDDIIHFLKPYGLRKNLVTRNVEMNGKPINDDDINTLFIDCKSMFDKATKDLVCSVIFSNKTEQYNPLLEFFNNPEKEVDTEYPNLNMILDSIETDTDNYRKWVTKWLVSVVASAHGTYSPLVLVFSGSRQGTGKTHFMRYLLPKRLRYLFAESDMDNGKDDEILMTKKLIILDDEYGGKSKREEKKLKKITAKEFINVREPYGRVTVDLRRLAVFCGTSNDNQIISDPTGNRRVLPINIISIDHEKYNSCDKEALWHELNHLYKSGYDFTVLKSEIDELSTNTEMFNASTPEEELLLTKFMVPRNDITGEWMTATDVIKYLTIDTKYVFSNIRMGLLLTKNGFIKKKIKRNGNSFVAYWVEKITDFNQDGTDQSPF